MDWATPGPRRYDGFHTACEEMIEIEPGQYIGNIGTPPFATEVYIFICVVDLAWNITFYPEGAPDEFITIPVESEQQFIVGSVTINDDTDGTEGVLVRATHFTGSVEETNPNIDGTFSLPALFGLNIVEIIPPDEDCTIVSLEGGLSFPFNRTAVAQDDTDDNTIEVVVFPWGRR